MTVNNTGKQIEHRRLQAEFCRVQACNVQMDSHTVKTGDVFIIVSKICFALPLRAVNLCPAHTRFLLVPERFAARRPGWRAFREERPISAGRLELRRHDRPALKTAAADLKPHCGWARIPSKHRRAQAQIFRPQCAGKDARRGEGGKRRQSTGKAAGEASSPVTTAEILLVSGRKNCKKAILTLGNGFSDAKIATPPAYTPPETFEMWKGDNPLALSWSFDRLRPSKRRPTLS